MYSSETFEALFELGGEAVVGFDLGREERVATCGGLRTRVRA